MIGWLTGNEGDPGISSTEQRIAPDSASGKCGKPVKVEWRFNTFRLYAITLRLSIITSVMRVILHYTNGVTATGHLCSIFVLTFAQPRQRTQPL